ncbi:hypothetical protein KS4_19920 [Poriferisphaera corsica]|uniref:Prepilin-type N-terminal cleavage/methylation domain-containing protein n=1 Tax=Poriferisphaera corsica TaxID=2528020 RepID=A0A517YUU9_9BACT|nr:type II secretion system protein [Poriferisphaera corsica]QDU33932.1 hypothetical protein KS4_19920 [Poriferisphaera corsica]
MKTNQKKQYGFTLTELLVVIGIVSIAMVAINQLFQEVTATVRRTTQTGEIIQKARSIADRVNADFTIKDIANDPASATTSDWDSRMVGPMGVDSVIETSGDPGEPGGFIVVIQHAVNAWETVEDQDNDDLSAPSLIKRIRSDQILYFVQSNQNDYTPYPALAPSMPNTYSGDQSNAEKATYARVWMGHTMKLPVEGLTGITAARYPLLNLGVPSVLPDGTTRENNPNEFASQWMLGRHVMLLTGLDLDNPSPTGGAPNEYPFKPHGFASFRQGGGPSWDQLDPDDNSSGIEVGANSLIKMVTNQSPEASATDVSYKVFMGLTDIAAVELEDITGKRDKSPSITFSYLSDKGSELPDNGDYKRRVLGLENQGESVIFNKVRMFTSVQPTDTDMGTYDVAATHTGFANNVSDFIVEFAGDLYSVRSPAGSNFFTYVEARADGAAPTDAAKNTLPPTNMEPDGRLDIDANGRIMWYAAPQFANHPLLKNLSATLPAFDPSSPIVYPTPPAQANLDDAESTASYRPLAEQTGSFVLGGTTDLGPYATAAFVWEDYYNTKVDTAFDDPDERATKWPWLIRIRYRLHDERGQFDGRTVTNTVTGKDERERGKWYEIIVPVNHQP